MLVCGIALPLVHSSGCWDRLVIFMSPSSSELTTQKILAISSLDTEGYLIGLIASFSSLPLFTTTWLSFYTSNMTRSIIVLGSTGKIGIQALEIIANYSDHFKLVGISGHQNLSLKNKSYGLALVAVCENHMLISWKLSFQILYSLWDIRLTNLSLRLRHKWCRHCRNRSSSANLAAIEPARTLLSNKRGSGRSRASCKFISA